jgi:hypothetical protein
MMYFYLLVSIPELKKLSLPVAMLLEVLQNRSWALVQHHLGGTGAVALCSSGPDPNVQRGWILEKGMH